MSEYIRKEDAVGALADYIMNVDKVYSTGKLTQDDCIDCAESVLDDLSSDDVVQVRHGHWTLVGWHKGMKVMECSCCKKRAIGATDFCPKCGAKMDREE